ncbi:MAG: hypothetical protein UZ08_BCD001001875 [Candidatus Parvibacillus calidus]|jgi:hypothetical protein|nr:MAG: hypothetical protein UZ08_BCD001001875 [Candidatus Parvibacillus calidus]
MRVRGVETHFCTLPYGESQSAQNIVCLKVTWACHRYDTRGSNHRVSRLHGPDQFQWLLQKQKQVSQLSDTCF